MDKSGFARAVHTLRFCVVSRKARNKAKRTKPVNWRKNEGFFAKLKGRFVRPFLAGNMKAGKRMAIDLRGLTLPLGSGDDDIRNAAAVRLRLKPDEISRLRVVRQSLDARRDVRLVLTVRVDLYDGRRQQQLEREFGSVQPLVEPQVEYGSKPPGQPVVVGAGPCGLFAALTLAEHGYAPLLIERGHDMQARVRDVERLRREGVLDEQSNVCFGAGGAGAFSDGKLTTRIKGPAHGTCVEDTCGLRCACGDIGAGQTAYWDGAYPYGCIRHNGENKGAGWYGEL